MWKPELLRNKFYAVVLLVIGWLSMLLDRDATAFLLLAMIAIPLLFSKENYIMGGSHRPNSKEQSS